MKKSFFSDEENAELFGLKLRRHEALRQKKAAQNMEDRQACRQNIFAAEFEIWKFFQRKLIQVTNFEELAELFEVARKIFGENCFTFELKESFEGLLTKFRDFIKRQCAHTRQLLQAI